MTLARSPVIDTDPHPTFAVYSAGNFAEVAPHRISPMAWSLVGDPVERGNRTLVKRLWPHTNWYTGSHYCFVGYFQCRPYHNLSTYCHIAEQLPAVKGEDATLSYFEDQPPPRRLKGLDEGIVGRIRGAPGMARELLGLRGRVSEFEARISDLEVRIGRAVQRNSAVALGGLLSEARTTLADVWDLHYSITMQLVPLRAIQRRLGRRLLDYWDELEPWVNKPDQLVWSALYDNATLQRPLGPGEFLDHGFYEIADDRSPWDGYRTGHTVAAVGTRDAVARNGVASVAWRIERPGTALGLEHLTRYIGQAMSWREMSKSLSMRCLHLFRRMVPPIAAASGIDDEGWPYLTIAEIADAHLYEDLGSVAMGRRAACDAALAADMPDIIDFSVGGRPLAAPTAERTGRGVSAGCATGIVVRDLEACATTNGDLRILVRDSVDADIEPALPHIDGIVTARGSALSHVAILMREHGIPAVVGYADAARLGAGQTISINGTTGEVRILA